ncbi:MAG: hypothetical protein IKL97_01960 [Eggerthellaceae bacterium]|nr:hypothetical protein [Eggerthellaceae bacterium]
MNAGISANGKHSSSDFGNPYAWSKIGDPKKKVIRETVPYMSGYYDFSRLYGGVAYESREIVYAFDLIEDDPATLHESVTAFVNWLHGIYETEIRDDEIRGYHFRGTCDECEPDYDESGLAATIEATFTCYPFRIADEETSVDLAAGESTVANSGMRVLVTGVTEGSTTITVGSMSQSFSGEIDLDIVLEHGDNTVTVEGSPCTIKWREELI